MAFQSAEIGGNQELYFENLTNAKCITKIPKVVPLDQPWAKCGLFAAVAFRPVFCGLLAAFCFENFAIMVYNILVNC